MTFHELAQQFFLIEKESSRIEMTKLLAQLLQKATWQEIGIICNFALGTLRPAYQGMQFNVAQKTLQDVVAQLLQKSNAIVAAQVKTVGDLGEVLVQQAQHVPTKELSVEEVYECLCVIEEISGKGSQEEKMQHLLSLLSAVDPLSGKYIVRIILGTLRLGFSDMTLIDALSWMLVGNKSLRSRIEHAYNITVDIGLIATMLKKNGINALEDMNVRIGIPIRPAAAERLPTAQAIIEKIGPCIAQPKLDGFRLQIHIEKSNNETKIHFFSRHLVDMSYMFPDLVKALTDLNVTSMIAEGEAITYDPHTHTFLPFQETAKRKRKHDIDQMVEEFPLKFYMFDILFLNGVSLLDQPHHTRRAKLKGIVDELGSQTIKLVEEVAVNSAAEIEHYFYDQINQGLEGIVVKRPDAVYRPGKRNFNWIKLKRTEEGHLEDTIDCVVLGYYAGSGKRADFGIGAFLVGVFNKERDSFETIAKIGTGLKDEGWRELKRWCDEWAVSEKPKNVVCSKELYPDVWVHPEIVCVIRADEITESPLHTAGKTEKRLGYALRFPRFIEYREDKGPEEVTTVAEIKRLYEDQSVS